MVVEIINREDAHKEAAMPCAVLLEKAGNTFFRKTCRPDHAAVCPACGSPRLPFDSYCRRCTAEAERQWPGIFALASSPELDAGAFPLVDEGSRIL